MGGAGGFITGAQGMMGRDDCGNLNPNDWEVDAFPDSGGWVGPQTPLLVLDVSRRHCHLTVGPWHLF
ncbi:MAG TPA: hypothetical protein VMK16_10020 [Acidimicrobiales bacterium]|nr:hypothetical protein [Acidimicrobiales bacterium]